MLCWNRGSCVLLKVRKKVVKSSITVNSEYRVAFHPPLCYFGEDNPSTPATVHATNVLAHDIERAMTPLPVSLREDTRGPSYTHIAYESNGKAYR